MLLRRRFGSGAAANLGIINTITTTGMFWLCGAFARAGFFYLWRFPPETKGRSLEEIDQELQEEAQVRAGLADAGCGQRVLAESVGAW